MQAINSSTSYTSVSQQPVSSYLDLFLQRYPGFEKRIQSDPLLLDQLQKAGLQKIENGRLASLALCAYFGIWIGGDLLVFENGTTPLHFAGLGGQRELIEEFLKEGVYQESSSDIYGASLAHYLAFGGHHIVLASLNLDLFVVDDVGKGVSEYAFLGKKLSCLGWMAAQGNKGMASLIRGGLSQYISEYTYKYLFDVVLGQKSFSTASLFLGILQSAFSEDDRLYTDWGIRLLQLFDKKGYYTKLQETSNPIRGILFLFNQFERSVSKDRLSINSFLTSCVRIDQTEFPEEKDQVILYELCKNLLSHLAAAHSKGVTQGGSFEERAFFILDKAFYFRDLHQLGYRKSPVIIGAGTFGVVSKVSKGDFVYAMKTPKHLERQGILRENAWFNYFRALDPKGTVPLAQKIDLVMSDGRLSIVMQVCEGSVSEFIRVHRRGIPIRDIQVILKQVLEACLFFKQHDLIHGDLKADNLLIKGARVVVTDFDSVFRATAPPKYVLPPNDLQTSWYRSPECMVHATEGGSYTQAIDMWSVGCIAIKCLKGVSLFCHFEEKGEGEHMVMVRQQEHLGPYPDSLMAKAQKYKEHVRKEPKEKDIASIFNERIQEEVALRDFVLPALEFDPKDRISPEQALALPFFTLVLNSSRV